MDAAALISKFRLRAFDRVEPYRWLDEEILDYLADAQFDYLRAVRGIVEARTAAATVKVKSGQRIYKLGSAVTEVHDVYSVGQKIRLARVNAGQLPEAKLREPGLPRGYILSGADGVLELTSLPEADDTLELTVTRTSGLLESAGDELEVPDHHALGLLYHVFELAYLKDDVETYDANRSATFGMKWREFIAEAKAETSRGRGTRGTVKYGGY